VVEDVEGFGEHFCVWVSEVRGEILDLKWENGMTREQRGMRGFINVCESGPELYQPV
jgi:hypothetical protein